MGNVAALSEALVNALCLSPSDRSAIQRSSWQLESWPQWSEAVDREEQTSRKLPSRATQAVIDSLIQEAAELLLARRPRTGDSPAAPP